MGYFADHSSRVAIIYFGSAAVGLWLVAGIGSLFTRDYYRRWMIRHQRIARMRLQSPQKLGMITGSQWKRTVKRHLQSLVEWAGHLGALTV
jgi:hypothetical protein